MGLSIDRQRYLDLVSMLAMGAVAGACHDDPSRATQYPPPVIAPVEPVPSAVSTTSSSSSTPTEEPASSEPPVPVASASQPRPNPYDGTPVTAEACDPALNDVGTPPACTLKAPGPTCESFSDTKAECPTLKKLLRPRVATAAIECLHRRSGTQEICEFNVSSICAYEALEKACLEPFAKAACDKVMAKCGARPSRYNKMSRESCEAGVSGIAPAKRQRFLSCISESCRFETCLTYL